MTQSKFDEVVILYNPISTGNGKENANSLMGQLRKSSPELKVSLRQTEYAGHGEKLAKLYAQKEQRLLLISSSGDGGYHEVINGVLTSNTKTITTSLLPSGNANDHYRAVSSGSLVEHIVSADKRCIDVLKITARVNGKSWVRYGHSYAGIGLTSVVGRELTREKLNFFNEKWLVLKHLVKFKHVSVIVNDKKIKYRSLIFGNIGRMSKVIQLSKDSSMTDGKFEVSALRYESKFNLLKSLFKAVTTGIEENSSVSIFEFKTIKKLLIQIDGEDYMIDAHSNVKIQSKREALQIIS